MALASVSEERGQSRGKRAFLVLGAIALIVLGGIAAYAFYAAGRESTDDAVVDRVGTMSTCRKTSTGMLCAAH